MSSLELTPKQRLFFKSIKDWYKQWKLDIYCCLPHFIQSQLTSSTQYVIEVDKTQLYLIKISEGQSQFLFQTKRDDPSPLVYALNQENNEDNHLQIKLLDKQVLIRKQAFPLAIKDNISQALSFELDRLTPFNPDDIWFDYHQVDNQDPQKILIELIVVPKQSLKTLVESLQQSNISIEKINAVQGWDEINLLPKKYRKKTNYKALFFKILLMALLFISFIAILTVPIYYKRAETIATIHMLDQLKAQSNEVFEKREALELRNKNIGFVLTKSQAYMPAAKVLQELTRLLPDNTWLKYLRYTNRGIEIKGESVQSSALIGLLESSKLFQAVSFVSPVIQTQGIERFSILLQLAKPNTGEIK